MHIGSCVLAVVIFPQVNKGKRFFMATEKELYENALLLFLFSSGVELLRQALKTFQQIPHCPGVDAYIDKLTQLIDWQVGTIAEFGTWKGKPIQWRVVFRGRFGSGPAVLDA